VRTGIYSYLLFTLYHTLSECVQRYSGTPYIASTVLSLSALSLECRERVEREPAAPSIHAVALQVGTSSTHARTVVVVGSTLTVLQNMYSTVRVIYALRPIYSVHPPNRYTGGRQFMMAGPSTVNRQPSKPAKNRPIRLYFDDDSDW
jgi:hypothetical protein